MINIISARTFSLSTGKNGYGETARRPHPEEGWVPSGLDFTATCFGPEPSASIDPPSSRWLSRALLAGKGNSPLRCQSREDGHGTIRAQARRLSLRERVKKVPWFREAGDFQRSLLVERRRLNPGFFSLYRKLTSLEAAPGASGYQGGNQNPFPNKLLPPCMLK